MEQNDRWIGDKKRTKCFHCALFKNFSFLFEPHKFIYHSYNYFVKNKEQLGRKERVCAVDIKMYFKASIIKTVWSGSKVDKQINKSEWTTPRSCKKFVNDKGEISIQWEHMWGRSKKAATYWLIASYSIHC